MTYDWITFDISPERARLYEREIRWLIERSTAMPVEHTIIADGIEWEYNKATDRYESGDAVLDPDPRPEPAKWQAPDWIDVSAIKDHEELHQYRSDQYNTESLALLMERIDIAVINERTAPHIWSRLSLIQMIEGKQMRNDGDIYSMRNARMGDVLDRMGLRLKGRTNTDPSDFGRFAQRIIGAEWDRNMRRQMRVYLRDNGVGH